MYDPLLVRVNYISDPKVELPPFHDERKSCDSQQDLVVVASRLELNPPASREERITRYVTDRSADCRSN
ncbi:hypothetical protein J6590_090767 [Homalodisca vitripennis]|nr:hypothetical protein J6590_090767 [Homalodisca vitripennis]